MAEMSNAYCIEACVEAASDLKTLGLSTTIAPFASGHHFVVMVKRLLSGENVIIGCHGTRC